MSRYSRPNSVDTSFVDATSDDLVPMTGVPTNNLADEVDDFEGALAAAADARVAKMAEGPEPDPSSSYADAAWRVFNVSGYENLALVLINAYDQSARGKGKERHANGKPFDKQPIMEIARMTGIDAHSYQIMKKAQEAASMFKRGDFEAAAAEFHGVIVYAAAAVLLSKEQLVSN